jgi:hypothetical protein
MGLHVRLPTSCPRCGVIVAFISAGSGPHCATLRCVSCRVFRGWVARATYDFIIKIIDKFGRPIAPITIRRGERTINSGSRQPERAPAASPAPEMSQNGKGLTMRKSMIFPSTHYNAADVRDGPITLTIDYVRMGPVGEGTNKTEKAVAHFKEEDSKLLVVSSTKFDAIALIAKSDDTDDWPGTKIALEAGKATYQGKIVDAVTIRAPSRKAPTKPDEIPY